MEYCVRTRNQQGMPQRLAFVNGCVYIKSGPDRLSEQLTFLKGVVPQGRSVELFHNPNEIIRDAGTESCIGRKTKMFPRYVALAAQETESLQYYALKQVRSRTRRAKKHQQIRNLQL